MLGPGPGHLGHAEVEYLHLSIEGDEDVGGLEVAMHQPHVLAGVVGELVHVVQTGKCLYERPQQGESLLQRLATQLPEHRVERNPVEVFHHEVVVPGLLLDGIGVHDVGV